MMQQIHLAYAVKRLPSALMYTAYTRYIVGTRCSSSTTQLMPLVESTAIV
jgi:hypothetical protein